MTECSDARCRIPAADPLFVTYHDSEWGVPSEVDQHFFEKLCLEGFQAGLSWRTVLHRRQTLRAAFSDFCPDALLGYLDSDVQRLMDNAGVIRNERKIRSVLNNANRFQELNSRGISLAGLFWRHEPSSAHRPVDIGNAWLLENAFTAESATLAKSLKNMGWSFVGPTTVYSTMQALGVVNDHVARCPRKRHIDHLRNNFRRPSYNKP